MGWWVDTVYLQNLPVKGKRDRELVRRDVSIKKRSFYFFVKESEQVWKWKGQSLWAGRTKMQD